MTNPHVLIVGAGPTGLLLALWLARRGVPLRIVDRALEPGTASRAVGVQARTLELYRQLGLADEVVAAGLPLEVANLWVGGERVARVPFGEMGRGVSPYPYMLIYPQDEHERLLIRRLDQLGVSVERGVEFLGLEEREGGVLAHLGREGGEERVEALYLAGCDGARSGVRKALGADFEGGTYDHLFYVADVEGRGPVMNGELHVALDEADFMAAFPLKGEGRARLIGMAPPVGEERRAPSWTEVNEEMLERLGAAVDRVNWFSTYHVHHRVAGRFRHGRAFLLGDAAHVHSPVGGQGMNTGLNDAANLAWKLAEVLQGRASEDLLDTYEPERIAFARLLVATTDRVFTAVTSPGPIARALRSQAAPRLAPFVTRFAAVRRLMFRTVSQTAVTYRGHPLSEGRAGVAGGDRLPWVPSADGDNFEPLRSLNWQVHVYGDASEAVARLCAERGLALHALPWSDEAEGAELQRGAVYLVRPDGYVALADPTGEAARLADYLDRWRITPAGRGEGAP